MHSQVFLTTFTTDQFEPVTLYQMQFAAVPKVLVIDQPERIRLACISHRTGTEKTPQGSWLGRIYQPQRPTTAHGSDLETKPIINNSLTVFASAMDSFPE